MFWTIASYIAVLMAGGFVGMVAMAACRAGGEYDRTMPDLNELAYRDILDARP